MAKRPAFNLSELTSEAAAPMAEAVQRSPQLVPPVASILPVDPRSQQATIKASEKSQKTPTVDLQGLSFKVGPAFRRRFKQRAASADLKLNELLFAALDAWEEKMGLKSEEFRNS